MKGVLRAPGTSRTRKPERGVAAMRPPSFYGHFHHLLIQDAENAILPSLAAIIKIVHRSLKSDENACKTPDIG